MRLLVRHKPISGESWPGYLLRLSAANRYDGLKGLANVFEMSTAELIASSPRALLQRLGVEPAAYECSSKKGTGKRASIYAAGRSNYAKVCPRCLSEMEVAHMKSSWDRLFELSCKHHQIFLLEACPSCTQQISHLRKKVETCDCGYKFECAVGKVIDIDISHMLNVLNLQNIYTTPAATFASNGEIELRAGVLIRRLNLLSSELVKSLRGTYTASTYLPLGAVRQAQRWFEAWPRNFNRMTLQAQSRTGRPIGELILGHPRAGPKPFPTIRQMLNNLDWQRRTALRPKQRCIQVTANDQLDFVGIRFVINVTGCTYDIVRYWISKGWLGDVTTEPRTNGQIQYRISKASVGKALQIIRTTSSVKELSKTLDFDARALRVLARSNVLLPTPYGKGYWNIRLTPLEVFVFADNLMRAASKGIASLDRRILIDDAILRISKHFPGLVKPLITALIQGEIPIRYFGRKPLSPSELTIKLIDLQSWRQKISDCDHAK